MSPILRADGSGSHSTRTVRPRNAIWNSLDSQVGTRGRRHRIPPAILRDPDEMLDGVAILGEHSDQPGFGVLLWHLVRDVVLWSEASDRERLFWTSSVNRIRRAIAVLVEPHSRDLAGWLNSLADRVHGQGDSADPATVAGTCMQIARWMRTHGAHETALSYAQAGALASSDDPVPALETARIAAALGKTARAETWLYRTIGLARRAKNWESYGSAYVELGRISEAVGNPVRARQRYMMAARVARRHGLPIVRGEVAHGLLRVAIADGDLEAAWKHALRARRSYAPDHPLRPALLHEMADLLLRAGDPDRAETVLRRLLVDATAPDQRMHTLALLARASVQLNPGRPLPELWAESWQLALSHPNAPVRRRTLVDLVEAARTAGDRRREALASQALREEEGAAGEGGRSAPGPWTD